MYFLSCITVTLLASHALALKYTDCGKFIFHILYSKSALLKKKVLTSRMHATSFNDIGMLNNFKITLNYSILKL